MNGALTVPASAQRARHTLKIKSLIYKEMVARGLQLRCLSLPAPACAAVGDARSQGPLCQQLVVEGSRAGVGGGLLRALHACELTLDGSLV